MAAANAARFSPYASVLFKVRVVFCSIQERPATDGSAWWTQYDNKGLVNVNVPDNLLDVFWFCKVKSCCKIKVCATLYLSTETHGTSSGSCCATKHLHDMDVVIESVFVLRPPEAEFMYGERDGFKRGRTGRGL